MGAGTVVAVVDAGPLIHLAEINALRTILRRIRRIPSSMLTAEILSETWTT